MATLSDAYQLLHRGSIVLSEMEAAGVRVDTDYLDGTITRTAAKIDQLQRELREDKVFEVWRQTFAEKVNLGSLTQLTKVLFEILKHPYKGARTKTGRMQAKEEYIAAVGIPFTDKYNLLRKLKHTKGTFLEGLRRETVDGFLHPNFKLHTTVTYRSSSGSDKESAGSARDFNFQNIPRRDPFVSKILRRCFIAREGRVLVERDFGAHEWRISACKWKDPAMLEYIRKGGDVHKDWAAEIFACKKTHVSKGMRDVSKNQFVFPILYGSYWAKMAHRIWEDIRRRKLKLEDGTPILTHLKECGITKVGECQKGCDPEPGTFEHHMKRVEQKFAKTFSVFWRAKDQWYDTYRQRGYFDMMTGFRCTGLYTKNDCLNWDVQGPAFHCLLQLLIETQLELGKRQMETLQLGQVHDSTLSDCPIDEVEEYLDLTDTIIEKRLPMIYDWIIVPLSLEAQVTPVGGSWADKQVWQKHNGKWGPVQKAA